MDKNAQLLLTANGHPMGERFVNKEKLRLQVLYAHQNHRRPGTKWHGHPSRPQGRHDHHAHGGRTFLLRQSDAARWKTTVERTDLGDATATPAARHRAMN
jgi:hypothetical protein